MRKRSPNIVIRTVLPHGRDSLVSELNVGRGHLVSLKDSLEDDIATLSRLISTVNTLPPSVVYTGAFTNQTVSLSELLKNPGLGSLGMRFQDLLHVLRTWIHDWVVAFGGQVAMAVKETSQLQVLGRAVQVLDAVKAHHPNMTPDPPDEHEDDSEPPPQPRLRDVEVFP